VDLFETNVPNQSICFPAAFPDAISISNTLPVTISEPTEAISDAIPTSNP
jgi:hypothetical protein